MEPNFTSNFKVRPLNWLPLPGVVCGRGTSSQANVDEKDFFSKGEISRYYPRQGYGFIKNKKGEEIIFRLNEISLTGPRGNRNNIAVGVVVGFDVIRASDGLHINIIKIY